MVYEYSILLWWTNCIVKFFVSMFIFIKPSISLEGFILLLYKKYFVILQKIL